MNGEQNIIKYENQNSSKMDKCDYKRSRIKVNNNQNRR